MFYCKPAAQLVRATTEPLQGRAREARERAQQAEALVVSLPTQLCGGVDQKPVYLYSGGQGLTELDRMAANAILARAGLVLKGKATASERTVAVTVESGRVQGHHLFWLSKAPAAGVVDEDAEAEDPPGGI